MQKIFTVESYIGLYEPRILEFAFHSLYAQARSALRLQTRQLIVCCWYEQYLLEIKLRVADLLF